MDSLRKSVTVNTQKQPVALHAFTRDSLGAMESLTVNIQGHYVRLQPVIYPKKINSLNGNGQCKESENVNCLNLNPDAVPFKNREPGLLHRGVLVPDLNSDWEHVQRVALGGIGDCGVVDTEPWQMGLGTGIRPSKHDADKQELSKTGSVLPFQLTDDIPGLLGIAPKQVHRVGGLPDLVVKLPCGNNFTDKVIPQPDHLLHTRLLCCIA